MRNERCTAPSALFSCTARCVPATIEDAIRLDPSITASMSNREIALSVPLGTMLFVDYTSGGPSSCDTPDTEFTMGIPRNHYFGRITSRENHGSYIVFKMACVLTRGEPGKPAFRTFSTRKGSLHNVQIMEIPAAGARSEAA